MSTYPFLSLGDIGRFLAGHVDEVEPQATLALPITLLTVETVRSTLITLQMALSTGQTTGPHPPALGRNCCGGRHFFPCLARVWRGVLPLCAGLGRGDNREFLSLRIRNLKVEVGGIRRRWLPTIMWIRRSDANADAESEARREDVRTCVVGGQGCSLRLREET